MLHIVRVFTSSISQICPGRNKQLILIKKINKKIKIKYKN